MDLMDLNELTDEQLVELQSKIEETKKQRTEKKEAQQRAAIRIAYGVKITCPTCEGKGLVHSPNWESRGILDACRTCNEYGYIWAPKHRTNTTTDFSQIAEAFTEWRALEDIR